MLRSQRGWLWRLAQSWWILLTFVLLFNWTAFLYIAIRTKNLKWYGCSVLYMLPNILLFTLTEEADAWSDYPKLLIISASEMGSIIHAFKVRNRYLMLLEARLNARLVTEYGLPNGQIQSQYNTSTTPPSLPGQAKSAPVTKPAVGVFGTSQSVGGNGPTASVSWPDAVNLNTATEDTIAALPGIGIILAKKALQHRQTKGGFSSVDEFFEILGAKAHVIQRVRPLVTVNTTLPPPPLPGGHTVDS